jgi:hypothetical protein
VKLPRTQKGKGLWALRQAELIVGVESEQSFNALPFLVVQSVEDAQMAWAKRDHLFPYFAAPNTRYFGRCCPHRPRQGYLESKLVASEAALIAMIEEVLADDPHGEVLLTPFKDATHSMVWTPDRVAIGRGYDGATSGKQLVGEYGAIPVALRPALLHMGEVTGTPFIEAVGTTDWAVATQLRDGGTDRIPASLDFIPQDLYVTTVVKSGGTLLEWEALIPTLPAGTVIDHRGGTQVDHYAWHARTQGIPVITTFEPRVGEWVRQCTVTETIAYGEVGIGASIACTPRLGLNATQRSEMLQASLVILHHASAVAVTRPDVVGMALRVLMKCGLIAIAGEDRHHDRPQPSREVVYDRVALKFHEARLKIPFFQGRFMTINPWGRSVGGELWARCTQETCKLDRTLTALTQSPSAATWQAALCQANVVVNLAHNGGWWFNKFVSPSFFVLCSMGHPMAWMKAAQGFEVLQQLASKPEGIRRRLRMLHEKKLVPLAVEEPLVARKPPREMGWMPWWRPQAQWELLSGTETGSVLASGVVHTEDVARVSGEGLMGVIAGAYTINVAAMYPASWRGPWVPITTGSPQALRARVARGLGVFTPTLGGVGWQRLCSCGRWEVQGRCMCQGSTGDMVCVHCHTLTNRLWVCPKESMDNGQPHANAMLLPTTQHICTACLRTWLQEAEERITARWVAWMQQEQARDQAQKLVYHKTYGVYCPNVACMGLPAATVSQGAHCVHCNGTLIRTPLWEIT